jgi:hypothetical protein
MDLTHPFPLMTSTESRAPKDVGRGLDVVPSPADSFRILVWHPGAGGGRAFLGSESFMSGHPVWSSSGGLLGRQDLEAVRNAVHDIRREVEVRGSSRFRGLENEIRIAFPGQIWSNADRLSADTVRKLEAMLATWEARAERLGGA